MFSDAIITNENNLNGLKLGITDQKKTILKVSEQMEEFKNVFMEEINKMNAQIEQLHKVLVNHAAIINNIKEAITLADA